MSDLTNLTALQEQMAKLTESIQLLTATKQVVSEEEFLPWVPYSPELPLRRWAYMGALLAMTANAEPKKSVFRMQDLDMALRISYNTNGLSLLDGMVTDGLLTVASKSDGSNRGKKYRMGDRVLMVKLYHSSPYQRKPVPWFGTRGGC